LSLYCVANFCCTPPLPLCNIIVWCKKKMLLMSYIPLLHLLPTIVTILGIDLLGFFDPLSWYFKKLKLIYCRHKVLDHLLYESDFIFGQRRQKHQMYSNPVCPLQTKYNSQTRHFLSMPFGRRLWMSHFYRQLKLCLLCNLNWIRNKKLSSFKVCCKTF